MSRVHKTADVQSANIGTGSLVWQHAIILPGAIIGENSKINAFCFIENDVIVGKNVTVKCGVYLWDGLRVEDNVFIGPNATFTNDLFPKANVDTYDMLYTTIKTGASIGANATILCGITIGENALIGAGSVVTKDIPANEVWAGNPARFLRKKS